MGPLLSSPYFTKSIDGIKHLALVGDVLGVRKTHRGICMVISFAGRHFRDAIDKVPDGARRRRNHNDRRGGGVQVL